MAVQTLASLANTIGTTIQGSQLYATYAINELLGHIPLREWTGDADVTTYDIMLTTPTASETEMYAAYSESAGTFGQLTAKLKNIYSQVNMPMAAFTAPWNMSRNQLLSNRLGIARACGDKLLTRASVGQQTGVAIGATATTRGIDGFIPSPFLYAATTESSKIIYLDFNDTGDVVKMSSDGGTSYGDTITLGANDMNQQPIMDADGNWALLTMDISDSAGGGNWTTTNAATGITLSDAAQVNGFASYRKPDQGLWGNGKDLGTVASGYTVGTDEPSANGDAMTLKTLDRLMNKVPWAFTDAGKCAFLMNPRTAITTKHLLATSGRGASIPEWMGRTLKRDMYGYAGIPVISNPSIPADQTVGTSTTCTTVYLVHFDTEIGYHLRYLNFAGANALAQSKMVGVAHDINVGSGQPLPFFYRELAENEAGPFVPLRQDGAFAGMCMSEQSVAFCQGITD